MYFALLDKKNVCYSVQVSDFDISNDKTIRIDEMDISFIGKKYENRQWVELSSPTNDEVRKEAYETLTHREDGTALIRWHGRAYTVNGAMADYNSYYYIESDGDTLKAMIVAAREYIKGLYPDEA